MRAPTARFSDRPSSKLQRPEACLPLSVISVKLLVLAERGVKMSQIKVTWKAFGEDPEQGKFITSVEFDHAVSADWQ